MNQLLDKLKAEDRFILRLTKGIQILYIILIPVYTVLFIVDPGGRMNLYEQIGGAFYVVAFLLFVIIFRYRIKQFKNIDYSLSSVKMLEEAVNRYKLWKPELVWALLTVLLIDIGMSLRGFDEEDPLKIKERILDAQYVLIPAVLIGFIIGVIWWYRKHKPLRDHALRLLDELKS